jgi:CBS domain-containing protein
MLVKSWMTTDLVTVEEDTPMMKASIIMKEKNFRSLPILNKKGKLVGIVSDRDLRDASPSKSTSLDVHELNYLISTIKIKDLMTRNVVVVRPDERVEFAAILMLENKLVVLHTARDFLEGAETRRVRMPYRSLAVAARKAVVEPQKRAHSPQLAAGLASVSKKVSVPYGRRFPVACYRELQ